jgi:hypothetical protein
MSCELTPLVPSEAVPPLSPVLPVGVGSGEGSPPPVSPVVGQVLDGTQANSTS